MTVVIVETRSQVILTPTREPTRNQVLIKRTRSFEMEMRVLAAAVGRQNYKQKK